MFAKIVGKRTTALATSLAVVIGLAITPAFAANATEAPPAEPAPVVEVVDAPPAPVVETPPAPVVETPPAPVVEAPLVEPVEAPSVETPAEDTVAEPVEVPLAPQTFSRSSEPQSSFAPMAFGVDITTTELNQVTAGVPFSQQLTATGSDLTWSKGLLSSAPLSVSASGLVSGTISNAGFYVLSVTAKQGSGFFAPRDSQIFGFWVRPAVTTESLPNATVGQYYSQTIKATAGFDWFELTDELPSGLNFNRWTGEIYGTPAPISQNSEISNFSVVATVDLIKSDAKHLSITVGNVAPSWGTISLPPATVGLEYPETQVSADGKVNLTYSATGLPAGLVISPSGLITGTPTGDVSYAPIHLVRVTIIADNGKTAATTVNLVVKSPPSVTSTALPDAWLTQDYNAAITTAGPAAVLTATDLPAGLSLIGDVIDGYSVDGTPTAAGDFTIKVTAANAAGSNVFSVTITVNAAPVFSTARTLPNATTGIAYSADIDTTGMSVTYSLVSGPAGMVIDSATGVLSGWTPADEVNVIARVRAENLSGSVVKNFVVRPFAVPAITVAPLSHGVVGEPYSDEIEFTGRSANLKKTTGSLPPGLTLERNGELHGTPTVAGDYTFMVRAKNWAGVTTQSFTVSVTIPAMQISTGSILRGGSLTVTGSGYVPGDQLEFWLHSTPVLLGTITSVDGTFTKSVTIPANTAAGAHDLVVTGAKSGTQSMPVTVTAPPVAPQRPRATTQSQSPALTVTPSGESSAGDDADESDDSEVEENETDDELPTLNEPKAEEEAAAETPANLNGLLIAAFALLLAALVAWFILWRRRRATES